VKYGPERTDPFTLSRWRQRVKVATRVRSPLGLPTRSPCVVRGARRAGLALRLEPNSDFNHEKRGNRPSPSALAPIGPRVQPQRLSCAPFTLTLCGGNLPLD
jgi:hypothetical protein